MKNENDLGDTPFIIYEKNVDFTFDVSQVSLRGLIPRNFRGVETSDLVYFCAVRHEQKVRCVGLFDMDLYFAIALSGEEQVLFHIIFSEKN